MKKILVLVALSGLLQSQRLAAQYSPPAEEAKHFGSVEAGLDHALVGLSVGYGHVLIPRRLFAFVRARQSSALLLSGNHQLSAGVLYWWRPGRRLSVRVAGAGTYTRAKNEAGRMVSLGYRLALTPTIKLGRWSAGVHAAWQQHPLTHIRHSDASRRWLHAGAIDGWYGAAAQTLRAGGIISYHAFPKRRTEIALNAGYQSSGRYDRLLPNLYVLLSTTHYF